MEAGLGSTSVTGGGTICVAMCTYNGSAFVEAQLASIAAQTRLPERLLILDDGSTDGTVPLLRAFAARADFPVDVYVNSRNVGSTKNFERAIRAASGDLIVLADQDDVWNPEKLARMEDAFAADPDALFVFSDAEVVDTALRPLGYHLWESVAFSGERRRRAERGEVFEALLRGNFVTGATMAFRSRYMDLLLPIPPSVVHDAWIALLLSAIGKVGVLAESLVRYRLHGGNQLGVENHTFQQRFMAARRIGRTGICRQLVLLREALLRLERMNAPRQRIRALHRAVEHLSVRVGLPYGRVARLSAICGELTRGRYAQGSNGISSAIRDLVL